MRKNDERSIKMREMINGWMNNDTMEFDRMNENNDSISKNGNVAQWSGIAQFYNATAVTVVLSLISILFISFYLFIHIHSIRISSNLATQLHTESTLHLSQDGRVGNTPTSFIVINNLRLLRNLCSKFLLGPTLCLTSLLNTKGNSAA